MDQMTDVDESMVCASCGQDISPERERGFLFGDDRALCAACALSRGGEYDELLDLWLTQPNVEDLNIDYEKLRRPPPLP